MEIVNVPIIDWSSLSVESGFSTEICEFIFQYNLSPVIMSPTHNCGNILDLVIVSNNEIISDILIHSESTIAIKSYHFPVTFKLMLLSTNHNTAHKPIHILDYSKGDYDGMNDFLYSIDIATYYNLDNVESA